ncbi:hypothetical protein V8J82_13355 [Gymnodinialimonas sp. 2305UL16-5]|uniref:hypothetical protein n=1 Tax=Gymnodinialimonas mytili TaxID=3126503 RepID=UPI003098F49A
MPYTIIVDATYQTDADTTFEAALNPSEMARAMRGLATYDGLPQRNIRQGETMHVDVTLLRLFHTRNHVMHVERLDRGARIVQSREHNPSIRRWDHRLSVQPSNDGCLWRDMVVVDAGWRSAITARFARFVYTRRHRTRNALRIRSLIQRGDVAP